MWVPGSKFNKWPQSRRESHKETKTPRAPIGKSFSGAPVYDSNTPPPLAEYLSPTLNPQKGKIYFIKKIKQLFPERGRRFYPPI